MLVGGGVGVTPCIAALRHLYQINILFGKTEPIVKEVIFVWSCKNEESYKWFEDVIEECWSKSGTMGFPKLKAYIYLTQEGHTKIPRLLTGRPNFKCIFEEVETDSIVAHRIAVIACGPRKLTNQVWDMTIKHSRKDMRFDFHHETVSHSLFDPLTHLDSLSSKTVCTCQKFSELETTFQTVKTLFQLKKSFISEIDRYITRTRIRVKALRIEQVALSHSQTESCRSIRDGLQS
jgi:hypothetical protein